MHPLAIPCVAMAAVNAYVGAFYLLMYLGWPKAREHLPFALLCFSVVLYDLTSVGLYTASGLADGVFWQRLQLASVNPLSASVLWFAGVLTGRERSKVLRGLLLVFAVLLPVTLFVERPGLTLSVTTPAIKTIAWAGRPLITYYESALGWLTSGALLFSLAAYVYGFGLMWSAWRRTRGVGLAAIMLGLLVYFAGSVNDVLVASQVYAFAYVNEYTYLVVVMVMAGVLLTRFVALHRTVEAESETLEHEVQDARADLKVLRGLLPICASCKRIRDQQGRWTQIESYVAARTEATFTHGVCPECLARLYPDLADGGGSPSSS
jgi:hypothetical protein